MLLSDVMLFGTHFNPFTREFWACLSDVDKPFVVKHGAETKFTGYANWQEAVLAKKPEDGLFEFNKGGWHKIHFVAVPLR